MNTKMLHVKQTLLARSISIGTFPWLRGGAQAYRSHGLQGRYSNKLLLALSRTANCYRMMVNWLQGGQGSEPSGVGKLLQGAGEVRCR
jgi:hypothetical protein